MQKGTLPCQTLQSGADLSDLELEVRLLLRDHQVVRAPARAFNLRFLVVSRLVAEPGPIRGEQCALRLVH